MEKKSAAKALEQFGFRVETLEMDPKWEPSICIDVLECFYTVFPPGFFSIITAAPPCTEYSLAMNRRPRQLDLADAIVRRTLEIIKYLQPEKWWLETPLTGLLPKRSPVAGLPFVDCDHCQFEPVGYQKPTRFFGSDHILALRDVRCDGEACTSLQREEPRSGKHRYRHKNPMGGHGGRVRKDEAYHIPERLVWYVSGLAPAPGEEPESPAVETPLPITHTPEQEHQYLTAVQEVRLMRIRVLPEVAFVDTNRPRTTRSSTSSLGGCWQFRGIPDLCGWCPCASRVRTRRWLMSCAPDSFLSLATHLYRASICRTPQ